MPVVAHFIRRYLPLSTTFIRNQILSHKEFKPVIVFRELVKSGFRIEKVIPDIPILDLPGGQTWFQAKQYHYLRRITHGQVKKINSFLDINKADVLHFHYGTDAGMFGEILKQSKSRPSVVSFYGYDCSSFPKWYWGYGKHFLRNRVFNRASLILAMSNDIKKTLLSWDVPKIKFSFIITEQIPGKFSNS